VGTGVLSKCVNNQYGASLSTNCTSCSPGFFCPAGTKVIGSVFTYTHTHTHTHTLAPSTTTRWPICSSIHLQHISWCIPGAVQPTSCPVGFYCPASSNTLDMVPRICPPGAYCPTAGLSASLQCPINHYCPYLGMSTPLPCLVGSFCPQAGLVAFVLCPRGSFCPSAGLSQSVICPPGSFCPSAGLTARCDCQQQQSNTR
jgi:hypothetical protein